jgi:cytochrome c oxidase subunit 3
MTPPTSTTTPAPGAALAGHAASPSEPAEPAAHRPARRAPEGPVGRSTGWWGMVLFIATETATFASLFASYFYLRFSQATVWPPPADPPPHLVLATIGTITIVASCLPMTLAGSAVRRDRAGATALASLATLLGGAAFVVLQVIDWVQEWPASTLQKDAYGSLFYSLTGLHVVHVAIGLGMLAFLVLSALRGRLGSRRAEPVALVALYWYFMAALAVAVYATAYLSPHL